MLQQVEEDMGQPISAPATACQYLICMLCVLCCVYLYGQLLVPMAFLSYGTLSVGLRLFFMLFCL